MTELSPIFLYLLYRNHMDDIYRNRVSGNAKNAITLLYTKKGSALMRNLFYFACLVSNRVAIICTIYGIRMTGIAKYASALYAF